MTALDGQTAVGAVAAEQSWLDLEGNSLPGILTRQPGGSVCYRPNLGDGLLGAPMVLPTRPSMTDKAVPIGQSFGQPFGDSRSALVDLQTGPGYQERLRTGYGKPLHLSRIADGASHCLSCAQSRSRW